MGSKQYTVNIISKMSNTSLSQLWTANSLHQLVIDRSCSECKYPEHRMNRHRQRFGPTEHVRMRKSTTHTIWFCLSFISNVLQIEIEGRQGPSLYREEYIL